MLLFYAKMWNVPWRMISVKWEVPPYWVTFGDLLWHKSSRRQNIPIICWLRFQMMHTVSLNVSWFFHNSLKIVRNNIAQAISQKLVQKNQKQQNREKNKWNFEPDSWNGGKNQCICLWLSLSICAGVHPLTTSNIHLTSSIFLLNDY